VLQLEQRIASHELTQDQDRPAVARRSPDGRGVAVPPNPGGTPGDDVFCEPALAGHPPAERTRLRACERSAANAIPRAGAVTASAHHSSRISGSAAVATASTSIARRTLDRTRASVSQTEESVGYDGVTVGLKCGTALRTPRVPDGPGRSQARGRLWRLISTETITPTAKTTIRPSRPATHTAEDVPPHPCLAACT